MSVAVGDLLFIEGRWYVTHSGLLKIAARNQCRGIRIEPVAEFCETSASRYDLKATVYTSYTSPECKAFVGYVDADPSNVAFLVHSAEMRVAETRAVNRALRKAYGIGIYSVEEIGSLAEPSTSSSQSRKLPPRSTNGNYDRRTVRDHLCQIIRQHWLDATLIKSYATHFCGVETLREPLASRSRTSSSTWPIGRTKTAMPYFASSTAILSRKKVARETANPRFALGRPVCRV